MDTQSPPLHLYFLPMLAPGHMIPMVDLARQFARQGVKATLFTTPLNAAQISKAIDRERELGSQISLQLLEFPYKESGLPEGIENLSATTTMEQALCFFNALDHFQGPIERLAAEDRPDGFIAGPMYTWGNDFSAKFGIPRLSFWGTGFFPLCVHNSLRRHKPHEKIESDTEEFVIPDLPDTLKTTKQQLPESLKDDSVNPMNEFLEKLMKGEEFSYGMVVNSFYELEPAYVKHCREVIGKKSWHVGPVSLCNKEDGEKSQRGQVASIGEEECLNWLNSKTPNSVVYVCFGSMSIFSAAQLREIAAGLEASGQPFIWVILKIGVPVGAQAWTKRTDSRAPINRENIEAAVKELMIGEEAEERRSRAIALGNMAKKAVEPGGSSDTDLCSLLEELRKNRNKN
nr:scopoletin glucosyltransferase-like [Ipomoea batatas]